MGLAFQEFFHLGHIDLEAGAHGGGHSHGEHVGALGAGGLQTIHGFQQGLEVAQDLFGTEGNLAQRSVQNTGLVDLEVHATGLQFVDGIRRPDRDNAIDVYMGDEYEDVLADGVWQTRFKVKPAVFTREEKRAWLDQMTDVTLGSDAFFPFGDNIERAHKSGVTYIAQPGGSVRDDNVIATCNKYGMAMAFTGIRLFHH